MERQNPTVHLNPKTFAELKEQARIEHRTIQATAEMVFQAGLALLGPWPARPGAGPSPQVPTGRDEGPVPE